ncbi:MAG: hypothetical protein V4642_03575, partial [Bacteroidota bacterium]
NLSGGIHIAYTYNNLLTAGFFINGEFEKKDTIQQPNTKPQPTQSLVGGQIRITLGAFQIDGLGSILFGDSKYTFNAEKFWEAGVSVQVNIKQSVILGIGGFTLTRNTEDFKHIESWGITMRAAVPNSPTFLVGKTIPGNWVFQANFPIPATQFK